MEIGKTEPIMNHVKHPNPSFTGTSKQETADQPDEKESSTPVVKEKDVKQALDSLNRMFDSTQTHLKFTYHEKLGEYYVQVMDNDKNELVKEIPSRKVLDMVAHFKEVLGILVDKKV